MNSTTTPPPTLLASEDMEQEITRLRAAIGKLFEGLIAWAGDEDGCFHPDVQPGIDAALAALRDGSCSECGGAGWRWVDTPHGECDMVLRRCAHVPGCTCESGGKPWHDAVCPLSEDNRQETTTTAPEGVEPFCACGHLVSECDASRAACPTTTPTPAPTLTDAELRALREEGQRRRQRFEETLRRMQSGDAQRGGGQ